MTRKRELIEKISNGDGTLEQAEQWLAELRQLDPYFDSSDRMLTLEGIVSARRVLKDIEKQWVVRDIV